MAWKTSINCATLATLIRCNSLTMVHDVTWDSKHVQSHLECFVCVLQWWHALDRKAQPHLHKSALILVYQSMCHKSLLITWAPSWESFNRHQLFHCPFQKEHDSHLLSFSSLTLLSLFFLFTLQSSIMTVVKNSKHEASVFDGNGMEEWLERVEKKSEGLINESVLCVSMSSISQFHPNLVHSHLHHCVWCKQWCFGGWCDGWCLLRKRQSGDCVLWQSSANVVTHSIHSSVCCVFVKPKMAWASSAFPHTPHDGEARVKECWEDRLMGTRRQKKGKWWCEWGKEGSGSMCWLTLSSCPPVQSVWVVLLTRKG